MASMLAWAAVIVVLVAVLALAGRLGGPRVPDATHDPDHLSDRGVL